MSTQGMQRDGEAITQVRAKLSVGGETTRYGLVESWAGLGH